MNIAHCEGKTRNLNHYFIIFACNLIFFASDSQGEEVGEADDVIKTDNDADANNGEVGNADNAEHETSINAGTQVKIIDI